MGRASYVIAGVGLLVLGAIVWGVGTYMVFSFGGAALSAMTRGSVLVNGTFVVPARSFRVFCYSFDSDTPVHIHFVVVSGGNRDINFLVMSYDDYLSFYNGGNYNYYGDVSIFRATNYDTDWVAPAGSICFVFSNKFSWFTSKTVSAVITAKAASPTTAYSLKHAGVGAVLCALGAIAIGVGIYFLYRARRIPSGSS